MLAAVCDAAAAKVGPPVRGAEPAWSCVEALKAAGSGDFAAGVAKEGALFSTVRGGVAAAVAVTAAGVCWREKSDRVMSACVRRRLEVKMVERVD